MGAVAWAMRQRSVSHPRSSNRTCGFPASGSPTGFVMRHTKQITDGALEVIEGIDKALGRVGLILESAGGASLAHAIKLVEPKGTIVVYGNSSGEPTTLAFADFRGAPNSRVQSFSYFTSEAEDRFAPDLALLVSLVA